MSGSLERSNGPLRTKTQKHLCFGKGVISYFTNSFSKKVTLLSLRRIFLKIIAYTIKKWMFEVLGQRPRSIQVRKLSKRVKDPHSRCPSFMSVLLVLTPDLYSDSSRAESSS